MSGIDYPLFRVDLGFMVCEEKARLVDEYSAATALLESCAGATPKNRNVSERGVQTA
jgi:hypothetical protein